MNGTVNVNGKVNLKTVMAEQLSFATALALGNTRGVASATNNGDEHTVTFVAYRWNSRYNLQWVATFDEDHFSLQPYLARYDFDSDDVHRFSSSRIRMDRGSVKIDGVWVDTFTYLPEIGTSGTIFDNLDEAAAYADLLAKTAAIIENLVDAIRTAQVEQVQSVVAAEVR
jgi:hypothetical protein